MKKILRLLKRRNNGGFTLVEVIISSALLAILILAVMGVMTPVMSAITSNEKNANAMMIAEAVEAYIDRNIVNSMMIAVYTNAALTDLTNSSGKAVTSQSMKDMFDFLNKDDNKNIYTMNVIGIKWAEDKKSHQYKYMLTKLTPKLKSDLSGFASFRETEVFDDCFYENLYPKITFEVIANNEHEDNDETKPIISTRNVAVKTTIDVYGTYEMKVLAAQGVGYVDFYNIRNRALEDCKLFSIEGGNDAMGNPIASPTQLRTDIEFKGEFGDTAHPETYIVYLTRNRRYYEPPATP